MLPGAEKNPSAPGGRKKLFPGAKKSLSAPGGGKKLLPGAKKNLSAPGGRKNLLSGRREAPVPLASVDVFASDGCVCEGMPGASGIEA